MFIIIILCRLVYLEHWKMMQLKDQHTITVFRHLTRMCWPKNRCKSACHRLYILYTFTKLIVCYTQEPNARFTYCQQYHFRTVTPISVENITEQYNFTSCSHNTALVDNQHPKDPDSHRKADLTQVRKFLILFFYS